MKLTQEVLEKYVGGQLEIQNQFEKYLYRGEIEKVTIEGEVPETTLNEATLKVRFAWIAKGEGYPPLPKKWVKHDNLDYELDLILASPSEIGDGRICLNMPITHEIAVFFPPDGSKLDPAKVEGLELTKSSSS